MTTARLRWGLVIAALVLFGGTTWRTARLAGARPAPGVQVRQLDVDRLGGGLLIEADGARWSVRSGRRAVSLAPDVPVALGDGLTLTVRGANDQRRTEVLRRPWPVFASDSGKGHRRIDFGGDPLGRADGVRDRVVLPGEGGWFHLVPVDEDGTPGGTFAPEHAGRVGVVAERAGLVLHTAEGPLELPVDEAYPVTGTVHVGDGGPIELQVRWQDVVRSEPVFGPRRSILGYDAVPGVDLVVVAIEPGEAATAPVAELSGPGVDTLRVALDPDHPTLLFGRRDRVGPGRGRVLPHIAADVELEAAVARGLDAGWIEVGPGSTRVAVPTDDDGDAPADELGWALSRAIVDLLDGYDRARAPVALRLDDALAPAAGTADGAQGAQPLRYDRDLQAWSPSSMPPAGADVSFRLPVRPGAEVTTVAAAFPISWRAADDAPWHTEPPPPRDEWAEHLIPVVDVDELQIRLEAGLSPFEAATPGRVGAAVAGGPDGTLLVSGGVRSGTRAFAGWSERGRDGDRVARRLWGRVPGDRWRVSGPGPDPAAGAESLFVRIPITARRSGWTALDLEVPGRVVGATWNDASLSSDQLPRHPEGGHTRLSVRTTPGDNLLALRVELPRVAPSAEAGGVRFEADEEGRPARLARRVVDRRSHSPVRAREAAPLTDRDGTDVPWIEVERAGGGYTVGDRWRIADAAGQPGHATLVDREVEVTAAVDAAGAVTVRTSGPARLWDRDGRPVELHPGVDADWPPGARLVVTGSELRLRRPLPREVAELTARPAWMHRWPQDSLPTVDDDMQRAATDALALELEAVGPVDDPALPLRGVVLVIDARTGDVLACATEQADGPAPVAWPCWQDAGLHPGSTFKLVTGGAALESGDRRVRAMVRGDLPDGLARGGPRATLHGAHLAGLGGADRLLLKSRLRNFHGRAMPTDTDLRGALRSSWNTWFGYVGLLMHRPLREGWAGSGVASEAERLAGWPVAALARDAGFDRRLDLGAGYTGTGGHVPTDATDNDAAIAARAIGQDEVTATPLGVATVVAAVVQDGEAPLPRVTLDRAAGRDRLLSPEAAATLRAGMADVVERGTASRAFAAHPDRDRIVGKTGSAQRVDADGLTRTDGWFAAAILPPEGSGDAPLVVVTVLPGAGLGGRHPADLVARLSLELAALRGWE